ncbi:hypothetical protein HYU17_05370 [Candidatus Woesearchaeota archaeon]|nr:hypothetical protein [Candidatus Woesearchaeota archaeon]
MVSQAAPHFSLEVEVAEQIQSLEKMAVCQSMNKGSMAYSRAPLLRHNGTAVYFLVEKLRKCLFFEKAGLEMVVALCESLGKPTEQVFIRVPLPKFPLSLHLLSAQSYLLICYHQQPKPERISLHLIALPSSNLVLHCLANDSQQSVLPGLTSGVQYSTVLKMPDVRVDAQTAAQILGISYKSFQTNACRRYPWLFPAEEKKETTLSLLERCAHLRAKKGPQDYGTRQATLQDTLNRLREYESTQANIQK